MRLRIILYLFLIIIPVGIIFAYQYWNFRIPSQLFVQEPDFSLRETEGIKHTVNLNDIVSAGAPRDNIPSIDQPKFESVLTGDIYLKDDGYGIDLEVNGRHRFYPYQLLVWHEIVNDEFNGQPVLVTYCPLCESAVVFDRRVGQETIEFGTSGRLWNNNLVMYDRKTETLWNQILGQGIRGELAGWKLQQIPVQVMTWNSWKKIYPEGEVLTRDTGVERDYTRDPYGDYYQNSKVMFPLTHKNDRLNVKDRIYGVSQNDQMAYLRDAVAEEKVVNDEIGGAPAVLVYNNYTDSVKVFLRQVNNQVLTFSNIGQTLIDEQTGSEWNLDGLAVGGDMIGIQLEELPVIPAFWFCWSAVYPNTNLHLP